MLLSLYSCGELDKKDENVSSHEIFMWLKFGIYEVF